MKNAENNSFWNRNISAKLWQLVVGAVAVAVVSVSLTVTVDAVHGDNARRSESNSEAGVSTSENDRLKDATQSRKSKRGNLIKKVGDVAAIKTKSGKTIASWTLTKIDAAPQCVADSGVAEKQPENGHFVVLSFDVKTADASVDTEGSLPLSLGSPAVWRYYLKDGTLWNGNPDGDYSGSCIDSNERLPGNIGAGTRASGKVVFDLPSTDGVLVFDQSLSGGWEYSLSGETD